MTIDIKAKVGNKLSATKNVLKNSMNKTIYKTKNVMKNLSDPKKRKWIIYIVFILILLGIISYFTYRYLVYIDLSKVEILEGNYNGDTELVVKRPFQSIDTNRMYSCTFCLWVYLDELPSFQGESTGNNYIFNYQMSDIYSDISLLVGEYNKPKSDQLTFYFKNMEGNVSTIAINDVHIQKWLCIVVAIDNQKVNLYLNGELYKSIVFTYIPVISNEGIMNIKKENGFKGSISDFTFFNYVIGNHDMQKYYNWGPTLMK